MRVAVVLVSLGCVLAAAGPAIAGDPADAPAAKPDPNKIVCRSLPPATGTRIGGRRVCKTQGQWDRERQQAQDTLNKKQIRRSPTERSN